MIPVKGDAMTSDIGFTNLVGISTLPVDVSFLREVSSLTTSDYWTFCILKPSELEDICVINFSMSFGLTGSFLTVCFAMLTN